MTNPTLSKTETVELFENLDRLATSEEVSQFWTNLLTWLLAKQATK